MYQDLTPAFAPSFFHTTGFLSSPLLVVVASLTRHDHHQGRDEGRQAGLCGLSGPTLLVVALALVAVAQVNLNVHAPLASDHLSN